MLLTTKEQADIVVAASKFVLGHVTWKPTGVRHKLSVRVGFEETPSFLIGHNFELKLVGNVGARNHGFSLLLNHITLKRYDFGGPHTNPDGSRASKAHKHYWTPTDGTNWMYQPDDIDPNTSINDQFFSFCQECNIDVRGSYQHLLAGD